MKYTDDVMDYETVEGENVRIDALPKRSVFNLGLVSRAIARLTKLNLGPEHILPCQLTEVTSDLAGDTFNTLYHIPDYKENTPPSRVVNTEVLKYAEREGMLENVRNSTRGSILTSMMTAPILWASLTSDAFLRGMIEKQNELDQKQQDLEQQEQSLKEMLLSGQGGSQEANDLSDTIDKAKEGLEQEAQALASEAQNTLDTSQTARAAVMASCNEAAKEGEDIAQAVAGWGLDDGEMHSADPAEIERTVKILNDQMLREVAAVMGRMRGFSMRSRHTKFSEQMIPDGVEYTQDLDHIFPDEVLEMLAGHQPLRIIKMLEFCERGLLGWKLTTRPKECGNVMIYVDQSGSMGAPSVYDGHYVDNYLLAKAIARGMVDALQVEEDRDYILATFSASLSSIRKVTKSSSFEDFVYWIEYFPKGGTNVDMVLQDIMTNKEFVENGADVVIITDGYFDIDWKVVDDFLDFKAETGVRLMMLMVGGDYLSPNTEKVVDAHFCVNEFSDSNDKAMMTAMANWFR